MKITATANSFAGIYGSTTINHRIRAKLGLTCEQYVLMDYLQKIYKGKALTRIEIDKGFYKHAGTINYHVLSMLIFLHMVEESATLGYSPSDKWRKEFDVKFEKEFEAFWKIYGKVGNRKAAQSMFVKLREKRQYKQILEKHQKYVQHLKDNTWKGKMHCSTWLNPTNERFLDEYNNTGEAKKKEEDPKFGL